MKTIVLLLLLVASPLLAQEDGAKQHLDLSGEWRRSPDDRPEYAGAGVDETRWETVRIPWADRPPLGRYWLRRTIELPPQLQNRTLFLVIGPIAEACQIFRNGRLVGGTEESPDGVPTQRARSRFFQLSSEPTNRLTIAIRVHRPSAPPSLIYYAGGSYILTPESPALADENQLLVFRQQRKFVTNLVIGYVLLSFAVLLWLLWMSERRRMELLWLGFLSASRGAYSLSAYFAISGDPAALNPISSALDALTGAALAELVLSLMSRLRQKPWLRAFFWGAWTLYVLFSWPTLATTRWLGGLTLALIAFGWLREHRLGLGPDRLMWLFLTLVALAFLNTGVSVVPLGFEVQGYEYSFRSFAITILSVLIASGSLRRLIADRRQKQRLESEFEAASAVQRLMLAAPALHEPGLTLDAVYMPAMEVGGDFYYVLDGGQVVVVGDVSGKGLKAAMLVSLLIGVMRETTERRPGALLAALNRAIAGRTDGGFVTCCCVRVDHDGLVTIANAGHLAPYLDGTEPLLESGLPLGLSPELDWPETELRLLPGSMLTLVSDGVVEAANSTGELFGFDRTRSISTKSAHEIAEAARDWGQNDDITVVTVRCANQPG